jgi:hypothetical protein
MSKFKNKKRIFWLLTPVLAIAIMAGSMTACSDEDGGGGGGIPFLVALDLLGISPCPNQFLLTDPTFLGDLLAATSFIMTYDQSDDATGAYCS